MIRIPQPGERVVYSKKSDNVILSFEGYNQLELGKAYTVDLCFRITEYKACDDLENWCLSLVGIKDFGYQLDCFTSLEEHRALKLNELLD